MKHLFLQFLRFGSQEQKILAQMLDQVRPSRGVQGSSLPLPEQTGSVADLANTATEMEEWHNQGGDES